jgi:hypothetical protein
MNILSALQNVVLVFSATGINYEVMEVLGIRGGAVG